MVLGRGSDKRLFKCNWEMHNSMLFQGRWTSEVTQLTNEYEDLMVRVPQQHRNGNRLRIENYWISRPIISQIFLRKGSWWRMRRGSCLSASTTSTRICSARRWWHCASILCCLLARRGPSRLPSVSHRSRETLAGWSDWRCRQSICRSGGRVSQLSRGYSVADVLLLTVEGIRTRGSLKLKFKQWWHGSSQFTHIQRHTGRQEKPRSSASRPLVCQSLEFPRTACRSS